MIWENKAATILTIKFGDGVAANAVFDEKSISIAGGGNGETPVTGSVGGETECNITPCKSEREYPMVAPKVKVGVEP